MKKLLSVLIAGVILVSTSFSAFASQAPTSQKVFEQMEGAVNFLTEGKTAYTVDDVVDYYTLVSSGVDMSKYNDGFLKNLKENLDANNGKVVSMYGESLATYGGVILILDFLGEDPTDFYGYDITKAFTAMDPEVRQASPYYYQLVLPATELVGNEEFTNKIVDFFVNEYYTENKGMKDGWGYYSSDNTGYFINIIAPYADKYPEEMADAFEVLESYKIDGGYYSSEYITSANANSTGLALMAYASYSPFDNEKEYYEKLNSIYAELCAFETETTGVFGNAIATKDSLRGLKKYYEVLVLQENTTTPEEPTTDKEPTTDNTTDTTDKAEDTVTEKEETTTQVKENNSEKSPATGAGLTAVSFAFALAMGAGATVIAKRKEK